MAPDPHHRRAILLLLAAALVPAGCARGTDSPPPSAAEPRADPFVAGHGSGPWLQYSSPEAAGFSSAALDSARLYADSGGSAAVFAVYRGRVIAAWGDIERELGLHSVRKSLVSGLYGTAVAAGEVDLEATLDALGVDDDGVLTPTEKQASVRDLLSARSGIYLGAAYAPSSQAEERPDRGAHPPGAHWFYNNWDFNVAGVIYERETGEDLYESFARRIARPLGMEDWTPTDGMRVYEPGQSRHPAHTFRMSARDLARFGQLYLQDGRWEGRSVIPRDWVRESTRPVSDFGNGRGYGYMWWTYAAGSFGDRYGPLDGYDAYAGQGTGGQLVAVIPDLDLVVVHRGDTDNGRPVGGGRAWAIVARIVDARRGEAHADPPLEPVRPVPFESQLPPYQAPETVALPDHILDDYYGEYRLAPGAIIRVFEWRDRPFVFMPGEGEAELFATARDTFTIRVITGVRIVFRRGPDGRVTGLDGSLGDQTFQAERIDPAAAGSGTGAGNGPEPVTTPDPRTLSWAGLPSHVTFGTLFHPRSPRPPLEKP
jgi:CubicO group peptidase (beta-lactamase class C family)